MTCDERRVKNLCLLVTRHSSLVTVFMKNKLRVGVVFGGRSGEHEVSVCSAGSVIAAMDERKYDYK